MSDTKEAKSTTRRFFGNVFATACVVALSIAATMPILLVVGLPLRVSLPLALGYLIVLTAGILTIMEAR